MKPSTTASWGGNGVPISRASGSSSAKLGVVILSQPVEKGKAVDLKTLPAPVSTVTIAKQPEGTPEYKPGKVFLMNITSYIRDAAAAGEKKFSGFALRCVPDRGVDDGYTIRLTVSPTNPIYLELDVYAK